MGGAGGECDEGIESFEMNPRCAPPRRVGASRWSNSWRTRVTKYVTKTAAPAKASSMPREATCIESFVTCDSESRCGGGCGDSTP